MNGAVVLFGHGARDPAWAEPMQRVRARMLADEPRLHVELAFLELMAPTLSEAIDTLVAAGQSLIVVVPVFLAQGGHLKRDVPALVAAARERHPTVDIALARAVGEAEEVIGAMAGYARASFERVQADLPPHTRSL